MNFTQKDVAEISRHLSLERLQTFRAVTRTEVEAIALHQETMLLGAILMSIIGIIEIAIRNRVSEQLEQAFKSDWLLKPTAPFQWKEREQKAIREAKRSAQRAEYQKLTYREKQALDNVAFPNGIPNIPEQKRHAKIVQLRQQTIAIGNGQIVAHLMLQFWKRLFSEHYEQVLWTRTLKKVFPNKTLKRTDVAKHLEVLYKARNRIAHHEPIYGTKLSDVLSSIEFIIENFTSPKPSKNTPLIKLLKPQRKLLNRQVRAFNKTWARFTRSPQVSEPIFMVISRSFLFLKWRARRDSNS